MPKFYNEIIAAIANFFGKKADDMTEAEAHDQLTKAGTLEDLRASIRKEYEQQLAKFEEDAKTAKEHAIELEAKVGRLEATIEEQKARIADLEKEPAAEHTKGAKEAAEGKAEKPWLNSPMNQQIRQKMTK